MEILFALMPLIAVLPSLFPRWRDVGMAAAIFIVYYVFISCWVFNEMDGVRAEGPEFFGVMIFMGFSQAIFAGTCLIKAIIFALISSVKTVSGERLTKFLVVIGVFFFAIFLLMKVAFISVVLFSLPSLWLALVIWQATHGSRSRIPV